MRTEREVSGPRPGYLGMVARRNRWQLVEVLINESLGQAVRIFSIGCVPRIEEQPTGSGR